MHKIIVIILSFSILLQSVNLEAADIYKIPILVDHITTHFKTGDNFSDFISLHYGSEQNSHKNEHKEHKELPFNKEHSDVHFQKDYSLFYTEIVTSYKESTFKQNNFAYKEPTSNSFLENIFQPPQM